MSDKLKNNPYYVPSNEQQEAMDRLRDLEEPQSVMPESNFEDNSFPIHNDVIPVHEVKVGKRKRKNKKYENNQELNQN